MHSGIHTVSQSVLSINSSIGPVSTEGGKKGDERWRKSLMYKGSMYATTVKPFGNEYR